jgi:diaminohydroxyphosphoribosylaminopyrimidine deaminase/5-amino-6-(5-phosphoribosylamino)uracil reductase
MYRCLQLASLAAGSVAPNPMVGAVLVYNNMIIGEGYHREFGKAHAEVNCINSVSDEDTKLIAQSTLYVSLEPCVHFGKTPPCTDLIIKMKIPKVVIGCRDNYEEVNGKGISKLQSAGVEVVTGLLEDDAKSLNKRFFTFHRLKRPYIILKWAQSSDGKIANADLSRVLISNELTNRLVHKWRSEEPAIMVGTNTAYYDDPSLTNRLWQGNNPVRVVLDKYLKLPATHQLLSGEQATIIFNYEKDNETGNKRYCKIDPNSQKLHQILEKLHEFNVQSVLVEGGGKLLQSFITEGIWDEARVITNQQLIIGDGVIAPVLNRHKLIDSMTCATDIINYYTHVLQQ